MHDFAAIFTRRFRQGAQVDAADQLLSGNGIAEIGPPPIGDRSSYDRQLTDPNGRRNAVVARIADEVDDEMAFTCQRNAQQDQRSDKNDADNGRRQCRRHNPLDWPRHRNLQPAVDRPEGYRQHAGPDQRR